VVSGYSVQFTPQALRDISKIDRATSQRILDKIKWLSQNMGIADPEPLSHDLKGKWKLRVGDWRVVYSLDHPGHSMVVLYVGHRSQIYKK
jgi:mRNA interferase RelE/StbE